MRETEGHEGAKPETRKTVLPASRKSGSAVEQLLGLALQFEPRILIGLLAGNRSDTRHEIEDGLGRATLLRQDSFDDLAGLGLREPALAEELVRSSSDFATIRSRAALMPLMKGMGEELAKFRSAGAASWAKRDAAYLL